MSTAEPPRPDTAPANLARHAVPAGLSLSRLSVARSWRLVCPRTLTAGATGELVLVVGQPAWPAQVAVTLSPLVPRRVQSEAAPRGRAAEKSSWSERS